MTVGFSTKIKDNPTRFPEKIWQSLMQDIGLNDEIYYEWHSEEGILNYHMGNNYDDSLFYIFPKKHTIRKDEKNKWKKGNDIHFVINNRTKNRFQFAPVIPCTGTQKIEIKHLSILNHPIDIQPMVWIDGYLFYDPAIGYDKGIEKLAINDGFDSVANFFDWFSEDFTGKIIHWTNLKY